LAALLRAADRRPQQVYAEVQYVQRSERGEPPTDEIGVRYGMVYVTDGPKTLTTVTVDVIDTKRYVVDEQVVGENGEYEFRLIRVAKDQPWLLALASPPSNGKSETTTPGWDFYEPLFKVAGVKLADRIEDTAFDTTILPDGLGRWVIEGRRRVADEGLQKYRAEVGATARYAYIRASRCSFLEKQEYEQETTNTFVEDDIPLPQSSKQVTRFRTPTGPAANIHEQTYQVRLVLTDADRAAFRLPHYGLPEPDLTPYTPPVIKIPPRSQETYTWILLLPVGGVLLLLVGRQLLRKRTPTAGPAPPTS
jgi:hypothetical protein